MFNQTPYARAFIQKSAFVPYTQEALNPPPPSAGAPQGAPQGAPPPQDQQAGAPPAQGGMPPIQIVQGPNGEPIDAETGLIVLDPQQGIEQDPLTGILFNKMTQEFATPEGQPLDPQQAIQMIEQAQQQQGAQPPQGGAPEQTPPQGAEQAPMPPQGAPEGQPAPGAQQAPAPQMQPGQSFDPSTGMMIDDATGLPVDPNTGMLIDPSTGQQIDPKTGAPVPAANQNMPFTDDPEVLKTVDNVMKRTEHLEKSVASLARNLNGARTDIQGVRRALETNADNQDVVLQRLDNAVQLLENSLKGRL